MATQGSYDPPVIPQDFWRTAPGGALPDGTNDVTDNIRRDGNVGLGVDPVSRFDVNGALVLRSITLANFAANSSIGTAATTVDINSTIVIPQTTPNIYVTLPAPTNTAAGRQLSVYNSGTTPIRCNGSFIENGTGATFVFLGAWRRMGDVDTVYSSNTYGFPNVSPAYTPNSGLNTVVDGVSTMPADTVSYSMADGNYVTPISLPSAVGRRGGLTIHRGSTSNFTVVATNTNMGAPFLMASGGHQLHFVAVDGLWRWSPVPVYPASNYFVGQTAVTIANIAASGSVGTAPATVDAAGTLVLSQTTASVALTLPNPVGSVAGKVLNVTHNGSVLTSIAGRAILPGETVTFVWDGNTWNPSTGGRAMYAATGVSDASGNVTFTFPVGLFAVAPVAASAVNTAITDLTECRMTAISNVSATFNVRRSPAITVALLGLTLLQVSQPAAGVTVHAHFCAAG